VIIQILHKPEFMHLVLFIVSTKLNKVYIHENEDNLLSEMKVVLHFLGKLSSLVLLNRVTPPPPVNSELKDGAHYCYCAHFLRMPR